MRKETHQRRRPGRPSHDGDLKETILDHAEIVFAERGYSGAKTREIAANAGVNQGLIRYYFGDKESLFDEVFRRRGGILSGTRHVLLDKVLEEAERPAVEAIVKAYLQPQWDMKYSNENGASFVRLQARLHAEQEEHALRLRREVYDASVRRYIDALQTAMPGIPRDLLSVRMAFLVGTYMFMLNDLGRIGDLTEGKVSPLGKEAMLENLVAFLSAGLRAPVS
ncbi:TetR/AcrR family transcriptional regulator [Rhizobium paranaense]|uniref:AcrR family transcriptional regulator n=1 Tax=Rhizobium paranaense TaxID=1650438 RepID=A0A7W8XWP2_9HYPH|nr:TetR/AcrR family transcriptional regulator [Rhizobium paranaense]MBB5576983.1 AcrR family transcriptional regulator [Rhizobium paranaense]